ARVLAISSPKPLLQPVTTTVRATALEASIDATRIECITQRVGEIVQPEQQQRQHDPWTDCHPWIIAQIGPALVEHGAPRRCWRLRAQPEECETSFREYREAHHQRQIDDH